MVVSERGHQARRTRDRFSVYLDMTEDQRQRHNASGLANYINDRRRRGIPAEGLRRA